MVDFTEHCYVRDMIIVEHLQWSPTDTLDCTGCTGHICVVTVGLL